MPDSIRFRPQTEADTGFVFELYASTRADEMRIVPWSEQQKREFVEMQFLAQKTHYEKHYPRCDYLIVERGAEAIGRLYVDRSTDDIMIIDITLHPRWRGVGIGSLLLRELLDEAVSTDRAVTIHVESFNPALRLYQRLGFRQVDTYGVYYLLRWRKDDAVESDAPR